MDKLKPLQDQLLSVIGRGIQAYGFEGRPKGQSFYKQCSFGKLGFHLAFIKHEDDFDIVANVGIRFDEVEELVSEDDKLLTKSERADTFTVGCELGNLSEGRQRRWTVRTANDVPVVADAVLSAFAKLALPYFEELSDAERVLTVLSGDGPDSWLHSPLHSVRAKGAVGLALLTQGKEAAQSLAKLKMSFLEERKDLGVPSFRAFLERIGLR